MHDIEPHYKWRDSYIASEDEHSPFYGREYDEFSYSNKIYNYFIHPQWDHFGSNTLYSKILKVDYKQQYAIIELIGEWNDAIGNDIMFLKREVVDILNHKDINKYILICENVLNFHGDEDCYYEEWFEDVVEEGGWISVVNILDHVEDEFKTTMLQQYLNFGGIFNGLAWRTLKPEIFFELINSLVHNDVKKLNF